jgi:hypothetical protein
VRSAIKDCNNWYLEPRDFGEQFFCSQPVRRSGAEAKAEVSVGNGGINQSIHSLN